MQPFDLHIYTRLIFGHENAVRFADAVTRLGNKIFIVTGGGSVKRLGYLGEVQKLLDERTAEYRVFSGIEPNPQARTINRAAREAADGFLAEPGFHC